MQRPKNRFQKFSGCYKCRSCGRNTRSTGRGDNENIMSCAECFDFGGIENEMQDNGFNESTYAEYLALAEVIRSKGGKVTVEPKEYFRDRSGFQPVTGGAV